MLQFVRANALKIFNKISNPESGIRNSVLFGRANLHPFGVSVVRPIFDSFDARSLALAGMPPDLSAKAIADGGDGRCGGSSRHFGNILDLHLHSEIRFPGEIDQSVDAEFGDLTAQKIVQTRPRNAQPARRNALRYVPASDFPLDRNEKMGTHFHARRVFRIFLYGIPDIFKASAAHGHLLNFPQPQPRQVQVSYCRLLCLLRESMKNINGACTLGHVDHPKRASVVPNADFPNAGTDARHRFPVARIKAQLHLSNSVQNSVPGPMFTSSNWSCSASGNIGPGTAFARTVFQIRLGEGIRKEAFPEIGRFESRLLDKIGDVRYT
jgi:hypothetical protein